MHELLQQVIEQLRGIWRFRWIAMGAAWAICLVGWAAVLFMPDTYEASARVFVDTRTALSQVTQGISVETNMDTQIQRVRQALLGGPQLEKVVREAGLIQGNATPQSLQSLLAKVRDSITITSTLGRDNQTAGSYVISYQDTDRDRSLRVVSRLVESFVKNTLGGKREGTEQAQAFLTDQIADYDRRLAEAEARLADFKKQNVGLMPGTGGDFFTRLQTEMDASTKVQEQLSVALKKRAELERQLHGEQPVMQTAAPGGGAGGATPANDTASRIREAQAHLDELLLRFTDKHPDVIALRQTLEELKAKQAQEIEAIKRGDPGAASRLGLAANPIYQSIQLQLNQADVDIASLRAEISDHQQKIDELRGMIKKAPEVEAQLARLNRDYDVTHTQYRALVERLQRARLSEDADETGVVRFEVIDPPSAPFAPIAPNRPKLLISVLLGGLLGGAGIGYLLHMLKPVFSSIRQLREITGLPVLGAVSMTWIERHTQKERRSLIGYAGVAVLLLAVSAVVLVGQRQATDLVHSVFH